MAFSIIPIKRSTKHAFTVSLITKDLKPHPGILKVNLVLRTYHTQRSRHIFRG